MGILNCSSKLSSVKQHYFCFWSMQPKILHCLTVHIISFSMGYWLSHIKLRIYKLHTAVISENLTPSSFQTVCSLWKNYVSSVMENVDTLKKIIKLSDLKICGCVWPTFSQSLKCALWTFHPSACYSEPLKLALIAAWKGRKKQKWHPVMATASLLLILPAYGGPRTACPALELRGPWLREGRLWIHSLWPQIPQSLETSPHSHAPCLAPSSLFQRAARFVHHLTWDTTGVFYPQDAAV